MLRSSRRALCRGAWIAAVVSALPAAALAVPPLESRPGASHVLFLDFDGHVEPGASIRCADGGGHELRSYATDAAFLYVPGPQADRLMGEIWEAVAEDFAPFDVNVTTLEPSPLAGGAPALGVLSAVRLVIGDVAGFRGLGFAAPSCAGEGAYARSDSPNVGWVDIEAGALPTTSRMARRVSHEAGHVYGLEHHVSGSDPVRAAIMSYEHLSGYRWRAAVNEEGVWQDDLAQLEAVLGVAPDDHADVLADATVVSQIDAGIGRVRARVAAHGTIEHLADEDVFTLRVTDAGRVDLSLVLGAGVDPSIGSPPLGVDPNLLAELELWTGGGVRLAGPWPSIALDALEPGRIAPPGATAPTLVAGEHYHVVVRSQGGYGDLGLYTLLGDGPVADLSGPRVAALTEACPESGLTTLHVDFDQPVLPALSGIPGLATPWIVIEDRSGPLPVARLRPVPATDPTPKRYEVRFASGSPGWHRISIGPAGVTGAGLDPSGQPYAMDQDDDAVNGEPGDGYERTLWPGWTIDDDCGPLAEKAAPVEPKDSEWSELRFDGE